MASLALRVDSFLFEFFCCKCELGSPTKSACFFDGRAFWVFVAQSWNCGSCFMGSVVVGRLGLLFYIMQNLGADLGFAEGIVAGIGGIVKEFIPF